MEGKWLNLFVRFAGFNFTLKNKLARAEKLAQIIPLAIFLMLAELSFAIISIPLFIVVSPKRVQESGFVFPGKEYEPTHFKTYVVRRRIGLGTLFGAVGVWLAKVVFVGVISFYLLGATALLAATQNWTFSTVGDYTYPSDKIEVVGGAARLVDQGTGGACSGTATACNAFSGQPTCLAQGGCAWNAGGSGSTTNSAFTSNANGWTYASWQHHSQGANSGNWQAANGNPDGYVDINLNVRKNQSEAGYWWQSFVTTTDSPDSGTLTFDWKSIAFGAAVTTYRLYVFVDTNSGAPTLGTQVWDSGEISGTTNWAGVSAVDIRPKISTAGTYYLKIGAYATRPNINPNNSTYVSGFDNVIVNWSKAGACSGTATACGTFVSSPSCSAQSGCSWSSVPVYPNDKPAIYPNASLSAPNVTSWTAFTETATKNGGEIYYQLSSDDGSTWQYWNGAAWAVAGASDYNTASIVNLNIAIFSVASHQIKWKAFLSSDGTQQIILDNIAITYIENNPPSAANVSASQSLTTGYVNVNYVLSDAQSDPVTLINYEYSLTGAFVGEQITMTAVPSDPMHDGVTGLITSPSGIAHVFVWNAGADVGSLYDATVYVRLRPSDGIASGSYAASSAFAVDYVVPVVSNVTAVQAPASSNINIGYDLADDTSTNIAVELQVSSDNGATWTVPVATTSGDIGSSVSSGSGKTIVWQAGIDFSNQEENDMMARIRARDKYQNQGGYSNSAEFVLDNRAPIVLASTDLLAQPLAGAVSVLVGGSFSEGNPDANDFYVGINGGAYGAATVGDANTATPSNQDVLTGITLRGSDYVSAVKIAHTDDFGLVAVNENLSPAEIYKYVKPYTPPALSINNPGEDSLDIIVNKNPSEADGLEYAIFESTQSLYVQADGSLAGSPNWAVAGSVHVTGLSQPISQYVFKVKSRNSSDLSFSASSESAFSSGASSDYQSPQISIDSAEQILDGTKYVLINYTGTDYQEQANDLIVYEYSLDGLNWLTMTEKAGVGSSGVAGLPFLSSGVNLKFAWDVGIDLPNTEDSSVYIRLQSNDSITDSNLAVSGAFGVDTKSPTVSNVVAEQAIGSDIVTIAYDLADGNGDNAVDLLISKDSGVSYDVALTSATGDIGAGVSAGIGRAVTWNVATDFLNQESAAMRIKIRATDSFGNVGDFVESEDFTADAKTPEMSAVSAAQLPGSALVTVTYNLTDESASDVEFEVSSNSGLTWTVPAVTYSGDVGADIVAGSKSFSWNAVVDFPDRESSTMKIRVHAEDPYGHLSDWAVSSDFSVNTKVLSISNIDAEQTIGTQVVVIQYDLNKVATIEAEISSDGGGTWTVATSTLAGDVGAGVSAGNNKTMTWNAAVDFNNEEKMTMRLRLRGTDVFGVVSAWYESTNFSVDTADPIGLNSLSKFASTANSVTMNWSAGVSDASFDRYELWHGANQNDVINRSGTAVKWSVENDSELENAAAISTVITGIALTGDYYVKIWAIDDYGSESTTSEVNVFAPVETYRLIIQSSSGAGSVNPAVGAHTYNEGNSIEVFATPELGWRLDHWVFDGISAGSVNPLIVTMNTDHTVYAVFAEETVPAEAPAPGGVGIVFVDTVAPENPILTVVATADKKNLMVVSGLAEAYSKIELYDNGLFVENFSVSSDVNGAFKQIHAFSVGSHSLTARAIDSAGNISQPSDVVVFEVGPLVPTTPIVLSPKDNEGIFDATPLLIGVADAGVTVEITIDNKTIFKVVAGKDGGWEFRLPSDAALSDGGHEFSVRAIDEFGIPSITVSFVVNKVSVVAPTVPEAPAVPVTPTVPAALVAPVAPTAPLAPILPPEAVREIVIARELPGVPVPAITGVNLGAANNIFAFSGITIPNTDVVVYVHSDQALLYRAHSDSSGVWKVNHSQDLIELAPGEHTIYAVAVDSAAKVKSAPSNVVIFTVSRNFWIELFNYLNLKTTAGALVVLVAVAFWLYRIRKKEGAQI